MELNGKTAIITGSGRGLGKEIAMLMAKRGANIVLNDIPTSDSLEETFMEMSSLGYKVAITRGDVRNSEDVKKMFETAVEKLREYRTALISAAVTGKIDVRKAAA